MEGESEMDAVAKQQVVSQRLTTQLVPLIEGVQADYPEYLVTRAYLAKYVAEMLEVSRQAVFRHLVEAVASGALIEVQPRSDWLTALPGGDDLPPLYAIPDEEDPDIFLLQYGRPQSRGAVQTSFLTTAKAVETMLPMVRRRLGLPQPDPDVTDYYAPVRERGIQPALYGELKTALIAASPEGLRSSQASDILAALLAVLKLKPPTI
jgi:hypothetical protein